MIRGISRALCLKGRMTPAKVAALFIIPLAALYATTYLMAVIVAFTVGVSDPGGESRLFGEMLLESQLPMLMALVWTWVAYYLSYHLRLKTIARQVATVTLWIGTADCTERLLHISERLRSVCLYKLCTIPVLVAINSATIAVRSVSRHHILGWTVGVHPSLIYD